MPTVRVDIAKLKRNGLELEGFSMTAPADDDTGEAIIRALTGDDADDSTS
jgi:hypothetical protein